MWWWLGHRHAGVRLPLVGWCGRGRPLTRGKKARQPGGVLGVQGWDTGPFMAGRPWWGWPTLVGWSGRGRSLVGGEQAGQPKRVGGALRERALVPLIKGQGLWHSEICNGQCHLGSPTPPTAAAAMQWGSSRAACGLRLELSGPTKRPGSLAATGSSEPAHFCDKLRGGTRAIGAASSLSQK